LDELIRANHDARNAYMGIEKLPESKLELMRDQCADFEAPATPSSEKPS
jgi:low affinity Fe/Cu permease